MGCHFLLQGIFLTQGSNLGPVHLLSCRRILYCWGTMEALAQKPGCSDFCALKQFLSRRISQAQRCIYLAMKVGRHPVGEVHNCGWGGTLAVAAQEWITYVLHSCVSPDTPCAWGAVWPIVNLFISWAWGQAWLRGPWVLGSETPSRLGKVNVLRLRSSLVSAREAGEGQAHTPSS